MKMRPTQGVSYPRSGHAPIYHIARRYFGKAFVYCDTNNTAHCGCGSVPCVNPDRTFSKNHDFSVHCSPGVPIIPSEHYFIQYRSPVRSIASNFHISVVNDPEKCERKHWEKFAARGIDYWNRFIDKWVLDFPPDADAPLYCKYESLITDPEACVREILTFLSDGPLDEEAVSRVIEKIPISPRDSLADFKFYDPVFLKELEDAAYGRLAKLDLPSFTEEL